MLKASKSKQQQYKVNWAAKNPGRQLYYSGQWQVLFPILVAKCQVCGYDKCAAVLDCHHRDPALKEFSIKAWMQVHAVSEENVQTLRNELQKCDILCSNCHRELHWYKNHPKEVTDD